MKKTLSTLFILLAMVATASGAVLEIDSFYFKNEMLGGLQKEYPFPIEGFEWYVRGNVHIEADGETTARIECDGETVALIPTKADNQSEYGVYAIITGEVETPIILPKGKSYRIVLPAGAYRNIADHSQVNEEAVFEFRVQEHIEFFGTTGGTNQSEKVSSSFHSAWPMEVVKVNSAHLYRNGEWVEDGEIYVYEGDWTLNYLRTKFETVYADCGANYTIVIDEGAAGYKNRPDIVNERLEHSFLGTYVEPEPDIAETWPSYGGCRWDAGFGDIVTVNSIEFYFGEEVALGRDAKVRFISYPSYTDYDAVPAQLRAEPDRWVVYGDFGGREYLLEDLNRVEGTQGITFCLSEGAIYNPKDGTPGEMITAGFSGLDDVASDVTEAVVTVEGRNVTVTAERAGIPVAVYGIDGSLKASGTTVSGAVTLEVPAAGIYIVRTGSGAVKVAVNG